MNIAELRKICTNTLKEGRERFGLATGIVSQIHDGLYEVIAADSATGIPHAGDIYDARGVYCREVIDSKQSVSITKIGDTPGMCLHPLYEIIPCEAYVSSPIFVDGNIWGTLNYTSFEIRNEPFSAEDITYNEDQAARIAVFIKEAEF